MRPLTSRLLAFSAALTLLTSTAAAGEVRFEGEGHTFTPVWSLDGGHLAFEVNRLKDDVRLNISEVQSDIAKDAIPVSLPGSSGAFGSSAQVVVNPVWHKDGLAVFEGSNQAGQFRLYYVRPGGGAAAELITNTELDGKLTFPAVAPDGTRMAFVASATGQGDLRTRDTQTGKLDALSETEHAEMFPSFSSDGTMVMFTRRTDGAEDIFEVKIATGAEARVAGGPGDQTRPAYAGDAVVFFDSARGEGHWDLLSIDATGTKRTLARDVKLPVRSRPAVSPDGKWVAYTLQEPSQESKVMLARVDGSKTVEIETGFTGCEDPALGLQGSKVMLAFTALPASKSGWRFLTVRDVTSLLPAG